MQQQIAFELLIPILFAALFYRFTERLLLKYKVIKYSIFLLTAFLNLVLLFGAWLLASRYFGYRVCFDTYGEWIKIPKMCEDPGPSLDVAFQAPIILGAWALITLFSFLRFKTIRRNFVADY